MADTYNYITQTGTIVTDAGEVLDRVSREYKNAFGQDLVVPDSLNIEGASTPQGVLIITEALARIAVADNNAALANQINPNLAGGIFLDAILALTGLQRKPASRSLVLCTLTGVEGTSIPAGSQAAVDSTGAIFELTQTVVIPLGGTLTGISFQSLETGEIGCPAGSLNRVISAVLGWETITNPADAILGQNTQSDVAARTMRLNTLGLQGSSVAKAIMSNVSIVPNVKSMTFRENVESTAQIISGVSMPPHSIYACVDGGSDLAVAQALASRKSAGSAYSNTSGASQGIPVSQVITLPFSGQVQTILFDRPTPVPISISITVRIITPLPDPISAIQKAIIDYANGDVPGISGLVVGQSVSSFEIAGAVATVYPGIYVQQVLTSISPTPPSSSVEIPMAIYQIASLNASSIAVTIL